MSWLFFVCHSTMATSLLGGCRDVRESGNLRPQWLWASDVFSQVCSLTRKILHHPCLAWVLENLPDFSIKGRRPVWGSYRAKNQALALPARCDFISARPGPLAEYPGTIYMRN